MVVNNYNISVIDIKMACSLNFLDAVEALDNYSDSMLREQLEFLIGSNEGKSKLIMSFSLEK